MNRRHVIALGAVAPFALPWPGAKAKPVRYPHPDLKALTPAFTGFLGNTPIVRLFSSPNMWAEGPAWNGWGNYLVWSDIPTTCNTGGWRRMATYRCSDARRTTATATPSTGKGDRFPLST